MASFPDTNIYCVLLKWSVDGGLTYCWLPISAEPAAGGIGVTRDPAAAWTVTGDVEAANALIRRYRAEYGEHTDLTIITYTPERIGRIIGRTWRREYDPASAALVTTHWQRWLDAIGRLIGA